MTANTATGPATLTRAELYGLVWQTPMNHLAKRFGLSDQGLAKICERHAVPRPPQGHWNKLAAGKPTKTIALPPCPAGVADTIILRPTPQDPQQAAASAQGTVKPTYRLAREPNMAGGFPSPELCRPSCQCCELAWYFPRSASFCPLSSRQKGKKLAFNRPCAVALTAPAGQTIDYLATDIMRVADGLIVENWHVEDQEMLHRQLAISA